MNILFSLLLFFHTSKSVTIPLVKSNRVEAIKLFASSSSHIFDLSGVSETTPGIFHLVTERGPLEYNSDSLTEATFKVPAPFTYALTNNGGVTVIARYVFNDLYKVITDETTDFGVYNNFTYFDYGSSYAGGDYMFTLKFSGGVIPTGVEFTFQMICNVGKGATELVIGEQTFAFSSSTEESFSIKSQSTCSDTVFLITYSSFLPVSSFSPVLMSVDVSVTLNYFDPILEVLTYAGLAIFGMIIVFVLCIGCGVFVFYLPALIKRIKYAMTEDPHDDEFEVPEEDVGSSHSGAVLTKPDEKMYEKRKKLIPEEEKCVVCMDYRKVVKLKPCDHVPCCQTCYKGIKDSSNQCPLCREKIKKIELLQELIDKDKELFPESEKEEDIEVKVPENVKGFTPLEVVDKKKPKENEKKAGGFKPIEIEL